MEAAVPQLAGPWSAGRRPACNGWGSAGCV